MLHSLPPGEYVVHDISSPQWTLLDYLGSPLGGSWRRSRLEGDRSILPRKGTFSEADTSSMAVGPASCCLRGGNIVLHPILAREYVPQWTLLDYLGSPLGGELTA